VTRLQHTYWEYETSTLFEVCWSTKRGQKDTMTLCDLQSHIVTVEFLLSFIHQLVSAKTRFTWTVVSNDFQKKIHLLLRFFFLPSCSFFLLSFDSSNTSAILYIWLPQVTCESFRFTSHSVSSGFSSSVIDDIKDVFVYGLNPMSCKFVTGVNVISVYLLQPRPQIQVAVTFWQPTQITRNFNSEVVSPSVGVCHVLIYIYI
jgi:hypothetical protein